MIRYKKRGRKTKAPSKTEFEFMYYELGLTAEEMSKRYDLALSTIYNLASKYRKEEEG